MSTSHADRQAGSGFAMFSSVDFAGSRAVVVTADHKGTQTEVQLPDSATDRVDELLRSPTDARAGALARELGGLAWTLDDGMFVADDNGSAIEGLSVIVRGLTAEGRQLGSQILAAAVSS